MTAYSWWFDMDKRLQGSLMVAVLLSGGGAYLYLKAAAPPRQGELQVAQRHSASLEECLHGAQMIFAVHWAVACTTQGGEDDGAECDLPDAKAAVVNAWLDDAEKRCVAESRAAP